MSLDKVRERAAIMWHVPCIKCTAWVLLVAATAASVFHCKEKITQRRVKIVVINLLIWVKSILFGAPPTRKERIQAHIEGRPFLPAHLPVRKVEYDSLIDQFSASTHVHEILPGVFLGDLIAFESIFTQLHEITKRVPSHFIVTESCKDIQPLSEAAALELREIFFQKTRKICNGLDIQYILSVTPEIDRSVVDFSQFPHHMIIRITDAKESWAILEPKLPETVRFIDEARSKGKKILIHCAAGRSRSVTVLTHYIMQTYKLSFRDAYTIIKNRRQQAMESALVLCLDKEKKGFRSLSDSIEEAISTNVRI